MVTSAQGQKWGVLCAILLFCTAFVWLNQEKVNDKRKQAQFRTSEGNGTTPNKKVVRGPVALNGTYQVVHGVEATFQVPPSPLGVYFLAHGCSHGAIDFFPKSNHACRPCIGLPEEVNITRTLLARGYAVIAVSSVDRDGSRCWDASSPVIHKGVSPDVKAVEVVLQALLPKHKLDKLPLYAMGASSGGAFVLNLALGNMKLAGVASQISAISAKDFTDYYTELKKRKEDKAATDHLLPVPPTLFVHMPRDAMTAQEVTNDMAALKAEGVATAEIKVEPWPLTPSLLNEAAPDEISLEQSKAIYQALKDGKMLDDTGLLVSNPRASNWRDVLVQAKIPGLDKIRSEPDESAITEVFNVLWAGHEIVSRTTTEMVNWFEAQAPTKARQ